MKNFIDKATKAFRIVSCFIFAIIIIVTVINIVGRSFFNRPIAGAVEVIQYGFMLAIAVVMARTGFEDKHVAVDLVTMNFNPRLKKGFYLFGGLCGAICFGGITYLCYQDAIAYIGGRTTETLHIPYSILYAIICAGFLLGTLVFIFQCVEAIIAIVKNDCGPDLRHMDDEEKAKMMAEMAENGDL